MLDVPRWSSAHSPLCSDELPSLLFFNAPFELVVVIMVWGWQPISMVVQLVGHKVEPYRSLLKLGYSI